MLVGWIGMGRIGRQMALRVLAGGHQLRGHARRPEAYEDVRVAGGVLAGSSAEAIEGADLVCVNLYSEDQLYDVLLTNAALKAARPGAVIAIHSTVSPDAIRKVAEIRSDIQVLDAGFSGTAEDAMGGRIALMIGGEADALTIARPVFDTYCNSISHVGPCGAGMTLKLVNNLMFASQMVLAREALRIATSAGIQVGDAQRVLARASAGSFALNTLGRGDPEVIFESALPYLEKDVAVARGAVGGSDLGALGYCTQSFVI